MNMSSVRSCLPSPNDDGKEERQQLPWLVVNLKKNVITFNKGNRLYNFTTNQVSNFEFSAPLGAYGFCSSYSHGWLFFWDTDKLALQGFNPFSDSIIHLPPFEAGRFDELEMVVLSTDPLSGSNFEVLAVSARQTLAHFEAGHGDEVWSYSDGSFSKQFSCSNFIFYKDRLVGAYENYAAATITLVHLHVVRGSSIKIIKEIASTPKLNGFERKNVDIYLVETTKGDLLLVHRYNDFIEEEDDQEILRAYIVYKLICLSQDDDFGYQLIPIKDLGGDSLFLSQGHQSISVLASDYPGCSPNSIYYANCEIDNEIEVFNVKDESATKIFMPTDYVKTLSSVWIVPTMKL